MIKIKNSFYQKIKKLFREFIFELFQGKSNCFTCQAVHKANNLYTDVSELFYNLKNASLYLKMFDARGLEYTKDDFICFECMNKELKEKEVNYVNS